MNEKCIKKDFLKVEFVGRQEPTLEIKYSET